MARMWSARREIKRLIEARLLICKRQGVWGRVGADQLNQQRYLQQDVKVVQLNAYTPKVEVNEVSALLGTWERAMAHFTRPLLCDAVDELGKIKRVVLQE